MTIRFPIQSGLENLRELRLSGNPIVNTRPLANVVENLRHQCARYYTSRSRAAYWDGLNTVSERVTSGIYFYQFEADNLSLLMAVAFAAMQG
ncbi:MAG: hypothetical protein OXN25_00330 [Candidatus Poribacteria bacterium]|nr:hypothetical protein [Candidatus Poribacteria bacterium]